MSLAQASVPLKDVRSQIFLNPLTNKDKLDLLSISTQLMRDIYVNLEHKKVLYHIDPIKDLEILKDNYKKKSTEDFQKELTIIFNKLQDGHVTYSFPAPYSCFIVNLPIGFQKINNGKIVVASIETNESDISLGDELILYNKLPPDVSIKKHSPYVSASTPDARTIYDIGNLAWRNLKYDILPEEDTVLLKLKKINGTTYQKTLPWFATKDEDCIKNNGRSSPTGYSNVGNSFRIRPQINSSSKIIKKTNSVDTNIDLSKLNKTRAKNVFWNVFSHNNKSIGYLKIDSFDMDEDVMITEIRSLLENELKNSIGILIDIRRNPGGDITFAEWIASYFSKKASFKSLPFYIRANKNSLKFAEKLEIGDEWIKLIKNNINSNAIVGPEILNPYPPETDIYSGKVALLTSAECFSSCELFAASMKDNAGAIIYGINKSTFGGGANNMRNQTLEEGLGISIPQFAEISITYRLAHRLSNNTVIDDVGVPSDVYLPQTLEDVLDPNHAPSLIRIFDDLAM